MFPILTIPSNWRPGVPGASPRDYPFPNLRQSALIHTRLVQLSTPGPKYTCMMENMIAAYALIFEFLAQCTEGFLIAVRSHGLVPRVVELNEQFGCTTMQLLHAQVLRRLMQ